MSEGVRKAAKSATATKDKVTAEAETGAAGTLLDYEAMMQSNGQMLEALIRANEAAIRGMTALNQELMEFGNARLRENAERQASLSNCRSLEEAYEVNTDFLQSATQQYVEEAGKLLRLAAEMSQDYWTPLESRTKDVLQSMKGKAD